VATQFAIDAANQHKVRSPMCRHAIAGTEEFSLINIFFIKNANSFIIDI